MTWVSKVILAAFCCTVRLSVAETPADGDGLQRAYLHNNCESSFSSSCIKLGVISWLDSAENEDTYEVVPGVTLVRDGDVEPQAASAPRSLSDQDLDSYLYSRVARYVKTHSFDLDEGETARKKSGGGGGGGKKGGGMMEKLAILALAKAALLGFLVKAVGFLALKALVVGKIALLIAGGIALKGLLSKGGSGGGGGWSSGGGGSGGWSSGGGHSSGGWGRAYENELPKGLQPDYKPSQ